MSATSLTRFRGMPLAWIGVIIGLAGATARAAEDPAAQARAILRASGTSGGLVVHLGCGDGVLTAALGAAGEAYLVHGLDASPRNVDAARAHIRAQGLYGRVSIDRLYGPRLPYIDNLVNLMVVEDAGAVAREEIMRVLVPQGVAYVKRADGWEKTVKPRPTGMDEWTHYLYDATGNAVSHDSVVGPPRHFQWIGSPRWSRHHDHMASMSGMVSASGRVFYIFDEGPTSSIRLPARWSLIARDAFNGVILWKRPLEAWNTHLWPLKSGPAQMPRRLVAVGDELYVTLALDAPVSALDAATGRILRTYTGTQYAEELLFSDGVLFVVVNAAPSRWPEYKQQNTFVWDSTQRANKDWAWDEQPREIQAVDAASGRRLWSMTTKVAPLTLAADAAHAVFHDGEKVVCLDRRQGRVLWQSEPVSRRTPIPVSFGPTLVVYDDVVLFSGGDRSMWALSLADGKTLWKAPHPRSGHMSPEDLLVVGGLAWAGEIANGQDTGVFKGRDLHTGEVKLEFPPDVDIYWFHHRCYRSKATDRYLLTSRTGIEFIDYQAKHWITHHWVRGGCIYGIMPSNGLVYAPPHSCGCYLESKLVGINALAPEAPSRKVPREVADEERLERGPAYAEVKPSPGSAAPDAWPTYRHDAARSGASPTSVPVALKQVWQAKLDTRLSSPVVAEGKVFVASIDTHTVHALDAASGKELWSRTVGGRVDSPPTIHEGRVLFGAADGWVYCLRASDGELAWRFRVAPDDRRMVAYEQLESAWPVHGSVLVQDGVVYCVAGRSMFLDGGLRLVRLDPATGQKLSETILDDRDPETGENLQIHVKGLTMPVALADILSSDGRYLYMRSQQFDLEGKRLQVPPGDPADQEGEGAHLFSQVGFLDDTWFHRSYWQYGKSVGGGYGSWYTTSRYVPSGRLLVCDDTTVYGYGRKPEYRCNASVLEYELFAAEKNPDNEAIRRLRSLQGQINAQSNRKNADSSDWKLRQLFPRGTLSAVEFKWTCDQPSVQARAMVLAGRTLFVAGPPDILDERRAWRLPDDPEVQAKLRQQSAALEGALGGRLWAVSADDGRVLARYYLDALPVFDGLAAAGGRLVMTTADGRVLCLGAEGASPLRPADNEPPQTIADEPATKPAGWHPPEVSKKEDFARVRGAVVAADLGYRLRGETANQDAVALQRLPQPMKKKVVLKAKMRMIDVSGGMVNGFLALGDGPKDEQLVKCGLRFRMQTAAIVEGPIDGGKTVSKKIDLAKGETLDLTVIADLEQQKVSFEVNGQTVETTLRRRLDAVTHVGYAVRRAVTEFGPLEVNGE